VSSTICSVIAASGSYISGRVIPNRHFNNHSFHEPGGEKITKSNEEIIRKFGEVTGIMERRYVTDELVASDIAMHAAREALSSSGIDKESIDQIIVAHNFGDMSGENNKSNLVPSMGSKVKSGLGISNPRTVAYDLIFGCAGWLQGMIQADYYIRSGDAKRVMVIGAETLSRISDPHDKDSMIYSDGAGALILEAKNSLKRTGILAHSTLTFAGDHAHVLKMGRSSNLGYDSRELFLKMQGRSVYELALKNTPEVIAETIHKAGATIKDISKVLIHQANKKMVEAILQRLYTHCGEKNIPHNIMPLTMDWLGNSSVATLPTLYDLISKGNIFNQHFQPDDLLVFASLGAGLNINAMVYRVG